MSLNEAFVSAYAELDIPADRLVLRQDGLARFIEIVRAKTAEPFDPKEAGARLLNLRKKGLLPRLRRKRK